MGGRGGAKSDRSGGTCTQEWAGDLLGLRSSEAGLRSAAGTAIRVRTVVGDGRVLRVCHATGGLPKLRRDGGASAVGQGKKPFDDELSLVPGSLGQAPVLGRGGLHVLHDLEKRVRVGKTCGLLGRGPSGSRPNRRHWCG